MSQNLRPKSIYFDYQATTPVDKRVLEAMLPYFNEEFGNPHSSDHIYGWRAAEVLYQSRAKIAAAIGADADEIVFTSGATEANNFVLFGMIRKYIHTNKRRLLISSIEHKSIIEAALALQRHYDIIVDYIPVDRNGIVCMDYLEEQLTRCNDILLVSIMAVNNEIGSIQPIDKIGKLTKSKDVYFHCDAAQAITAIDIDVYDNNIDLLSLSAHKIYGPKGIGALFIQRDVQQQIEPLIYGGGQQFGLRSGTVPVALSVGFAVAMQIICAENALTERESISERRNRLVDGLTNLGERITVNGPPMSMRHPGNANLRFTDFSNQDIISALQPLLAASTGSACTSGIPEPSYVLRAIGMTDEEASSSIRFSLGRFTTDDEVEEAIKLIQEALLHLRE